MIERMLAPADGREQFRLIGYHARQQQAAVREILGSQGALELMRDLRSIENPQSVGPLPFKTLAVFIAAMVVGVKGADQVVLPKSIDLSPLGPTLRGMIKQQVTTDKEHLKTVQIDLRTMQVQLDASIAGNQTNVVHAGRSLRPSYMMAAGMVHTHPILKGYPKGHSLHFSPGDMFTFESNPGVVSIVACEEGVLMAVKTRESITASSALDTLERLKRLSIQLLQSDSKSFAQKFTKLACKEFGYSLYMTRDLDELVVRRILLD